MSYGQTDHIRVPVAILQTAITTSNISVPLDVSVYTTSKGHIPAPTDAAFFYFLHFSNFEQQLCQFDIYYGKNKWEYNNAPVQLYPMQPMYFPSGARSLSNISLVATNASVLPPMLNAAEIYYSIPHSDITTSPDDGTHATLSYKTKTCAKSTRMHV